MRLVPLFLIAFSASLAKAELTLSAFFSDHMVMQRGAPLQIVGSADPGATVTATLATSTRPVAASAQSSATGAFTVSLPAQMAGGPYRLEVSCGTDSVVLEDILIGDLWVCAGQSNMEWSLQQVEDFDTIDHAYEPQIRLFESAWEVSPSEQTEVRGGPWERATPDTAREFSAVGFHFAREVFHRTGVPIGLIDTAWGGTGVEVWISRSALASDPGLAYFEDAFTARTPQGASMRTRIEGLLAGLTAQGDVPRPLSLYARGYGIPKEPTVCYNTIIHPLTRFPVTGVIWYQGESNAYRADEYRQLFPLLIQTWRDAWGRPDLPFYFVQLASYMPRVRHPQIESNWAAQREAQTVALALPHTGMATAIDLGEADNIHPHNKHEVARRLSLLALHDLYGLAESPLSGPVLREVQTDGNRLVLTFDQVGDGLELRAPTDGAFIVASASGDFHFAHPELDGDRIVLTAPEVPDPVHVRYAWADNPPTPLYNRAGLPAAPFRTDHRPLPGDGAHFAVPGHPFDPAERSKLLSEPKWSPAGPLRVAASHEQAGNAVDNLLDGDPQTRWSSDRIGAMVLVDLREESHPESLELSFFKGDARRTIVRIETSPDGVEWTETFLGLSSGSSTALESFPLGSASCRYLLISFFGNTSDYWNSVNELRIVSN